MHKFLGGVVFITNDITNWQKYTLFIVEKKLRRLTVENPVAKYLLCMNGNRLQIKQKYFEKFVNELEVI